MMLDKRVLACTTLVVAVYVTVSVWHLLSGHRTPLSKLDTTTEKPDTPYTLLTANITYTYPLHTLPPDDYKQLISLKNFTFDISSNVCNSSILLLVLIHSSPLNFSKRRTIRKTWGQPRYNMKIAFAMGKVNSKALQSILQHENQIHEDIIQGSFVDAYKNMTYKHVMCLKYAIYHCPLAKYILKTDDDVFVNTPVMFNFLNHVLSPHGAEDLLACVVAQHAYVVRTSSKWKVSFDEYAFKEYPTYCSGWSILYSQDVVFDLYREAQNSKYFWIDDVHVTGTLAKKINVSHTNVKKLIFPTKKIKNAPRNATKAFLYGRPNLTEDDIKDLWNFVSAGNRI